MVYSIKRQAEKYGLGAFDLKLLPTTYWTAMGTKMAVASYESVLHIGAYYKPTETFQYTYYSSCHPLGVKSKGSP